MANLFHPILLPLHSLARRKLPNFWMKLTYIGKLDFCGCQSMTSLSLTSETSTVNPFCLSVCLSVCMYALVCLCMCLYMRVYVCHSGGCPVTVAGSNFNVSSTAVLRLSNNQLDIQAHAMPVRPLHTYHRYVLYNTIIMIIIFLIITC